ncbi:MAG: PaaI family thioesterase [Rhodospirillales bacterium]
MSDFPARNPDFRQATAEYAAAQTFLGFIGVRVGAVAPGRAEYLLPYRPEVGQHHAVFHGGVVGALGEAVMGAAAFTLVEAGADVVGVEYKCNFMAPGAGVLLIARGIVLRAGGRLAVCRADILTRTEDGKESLTAIAQGTMAVVRPR